MAAFRANSCLPSTCYFCPNVSKSRNPILQICFLPVPANCLPAASLKIACNVPVGLKFSPLSSHRLGASAASRRQRSMVCLLGGKDNAGEENESSPWKPMDTAMDSFSGESVEDVLRQQIEKQEFYDGGSGKSPPRNGGGGGRGSSDGSGESEDEDFSGLIDETVQVVLATTGFIFLYIYIIMGEELFRLIIDYITFLFRRTRTPRLKKAMKTWDLFFRKYNLVDKFALEKAILMKQSWFDGPQKYDKMLKSGAGSNSEE